MSSEGLENGDGTRLRWMVGALAVLAAASVVVWWPGCRTYPPVTSRESLTLMKLLYAACNTRDPVRLAAVEQGIARAVASGQMPPAERQVFERIIGMGRAGQWSSAERAAFQFAQDQVGVGHPDPGKDGPRQAPKPKRNQ